MPFDTNLAWLVSAETALVTTFSAVEDVSREISASIGAIDRAIVTNRWRFPVRANTVAASLTVRTCCVSTQHVDSAIIVSQAGIAVLAHHEHDRLQTRALACGRLEGEAISWNAVVVGWARRIALAQILLGNGPPAHDGSHGNPRRQRQQPAPREKQSKAARQIIEPGSVHGKAHPAPPDQPSSGASLGSDRT